MGNQHSLKFMAMPADDGKGPKQLGDPADRALAEVEQKVLLPLLHNHLILASKCKTEVTEYDDCVRTSGLASRFRCRAQKRLLNACIDVWDTNQELDNETREMYLGMRAEYRRTGIDPRLPFVEHHEHPEEI